MPSSPRSADDAFEEFLRTGEPEPLGRVFDATAQRLLVLAAHLAPRGTDAEDLLQSTFVEAMSSTRTFQRGRPVLPWLMGILAHQAGRAQRTARRAIDADRLRVPLVSAPDERAEQAEFVEAFHAALGELAPQVRRFLVLHLVHGLTHAQIAHSEECPPGTVKSRLRRGMARLRDVLPAGFAAATTLCVTGSSLSAMRARVLDAVPPPPTQTTAPVAPSNGPTALAASALGVALATVAGWWWWASSSSDAGAPLAVNADSVVASGTRVDEGPLAASPLRADGERAELPAPAAGSSPSRCAARTGVLLWAWMSGSARVRSPPPDGTVSRGSPN